MALYAKLAVRNVFRNRRRTLITLAAMGFGAAAIIVFGGFVHSIYYGVRESTIRSQVGHIQIYRRGYSEKGNLAPFDYLIADYPALRDELRRIEHVKMVTARLGFSGLVSTGDTTTAFVGAGVVPEGEMDLSALAVIVDGKELATRDPRGVTLGVGLARAFGVKPGDDLTLLTTTKAGAINALAVQVRGVWESGEKAYDDRFLRIGLPETQRVLDLEAGEVQSIVLLGVALAKAISAVGIQLPPPPGSTRGFLVQIFVVPAVLAQAFELSIVAATLASLYPAWRAARLNVVEALRHV